MFGILKCPEEAESALPVVHFGRSQIEGADKEIPGGISPKDRKDLKKRYKQLKSRVDDMLEEVRNQNHAMFKHTDRTRIISEKLVDITDRVEEAEEDNAALFEKLQLLNLKAAKKHKKTKDKIKEIEARLDACSCPMAQDSQSSKRYYEEDDDNDDEYDFEEFKRRQKKKRRQKNKGKETRNRHNNNNNNNNNNDDNSSYNRNGRKGYYDRINDWRDNRQRQNDDEGEDKESNSGLPEEMKPKGSDQLFITSGNSKSSEIIAVTHSTRCIVPADYPLQVEGAVGAFVEERPLICGGRSSIEDYHDDCFHYNIYNNSWSRGHSTKERRFQATAVMIDSRTWWITGGFSGEQIYNSTEVYEPDVGFRAGPKMPAVTFQHCIVKVNATHVFSAGGYPYNRNVWLMDFYNERWSSQKPMTHLRDAPHCAMVERNSGKIEVIVAGGSLPGSELSTEIFSVTDNRWRTGPKLPQAIVYGVSVPYRNSLVILGGHQMGHEMSELDTIYQYDAGRELWKRMDKRLRRPRKSFVAISLPERYNCGAMQQKTTARKKGQPYSNVYY